LFICCRCLSVSLSERHFRHAQGHRGGAGKAYQPHEKGPRICHSDQLWGRSLSNSDKPGRHGYQGNKKTKGDQHMAAPCSAASPESVLVPLDGFSFCRRRRWVKSKGISAATTTRCFCSCCTRPPEMSVLIPVCQRCCHAGRQKGCADTLELAWDAGSVRAIVWCE